MFNNYYTDPCQENRHRIVEMVSFKSIYQQLRVKFPSVPHQDVACSLNNLFLLICEKEKELIKWYLPNGKFKGGEYEDHQYTCRWSHTNTSRTGPTIWWQEKNYACGGEGVLTFAKHIKGYRTDLETVVRVAAFLGIDFSKTDVLQLSTRSGFNFIENVEPYPTNFEEDVASAFLGKPVRKYCFFTEQGALSYNLNQYADDAGNTVFLYETRQLCNSFDFLVNNAGIGINTPFVETTEAQFDQLMNLHFKGVFFLTQTLLPLINDGGRIVNVSSGLARFTLPGHSAYAAMKGAIEVLTRYLAKELGSRKIAVNAVAPGAIATDFGGGAVRDNEELNQMIASSTALGRVGLPDDIGGMIASLLSEENRWINGQRIEVSGGVFL